MALQLAAAAPAAAAAGPPGWLALLGASVASSLVPALIGGKQRSESTQPVQIPQLQQQDDPWAMVRAMLASSGKGGL